MLTPQLELSGVAGGRRADPGVGAIGRAGAMLVRCDVGAVSFCLESDRVIAVQRPDRLEIEPGDGGRLGWLAGAAERVPVWSLAERLGFEPAAEPGPVVVVGGGEAPWGLMVERVARVSAAGGSRLDLPELVRAASGGRLVGAVRLDERLALVLDPERLRPEEEDVEGEEEASSAGDEAASVEAPGDSGGGCSSDSAAPGAGLPVSDSGPASTNGHPGAVVLFSTGSDGRRPGATLFALSLGQVAEVLRPVQVTPVAAPVKGAEGTTAAPDGLLGVAVWRDRVVPVIDLGLRLGLGPSSAEPAGRLLVARGVRRPGWLAFPVRADLHVEPLPLPSRAWAGGSRLSPLAALGVFELAAGTVVVPDVDRILTPDRPGPRTGLAARSAPERGESDEES